MEPQAGDRLLRDEVEPYHVGSLTMSAALLSWFLLKVWRQEPEDVPSLVCDGSGDKGIDALIVDDDLLEITVIQGKWRDDPSKTTQGDADLRTLVGAADYFKSPETVQALLNSGPNQELRKLIDRQQVEDKIAKGSYNLKLIFVTNAALDAAGSGYVATRVSLDPPLEVWDRAKLADIAERTRRPNLREETVTLTAASPPTEVTLTATERIAVGMVSAKELIKLPGIDDHTIFSRNVRLYVGRTRINKELAVTVRDINEHKLFPAYHNGLTLLTESLSVSGNEMTLGRVGVVNGCQSLTTLNEHRNALTDDLLLVVKVVEVRSDSEIADQITQRSNNQNSVTLRDQRSSDAVMRDLQQGVIEAFGARFGFVVKAGEKVAAARHLENSLAAQLIMALYLEEPWAAVRKIALFDQDFRRIFNRTITPHKLFMLCLLNESVEAARSELRDDLKASFAAIRFTLIYLIGVVLRETPSGVQLIESPESFLDRGEATIVEAFSRIVSAVVQTVNFHVYYELSINEEIMILKVAFKSKAGVKSLEVEVLKDAKKQAMRSQMQKGGDDSYLFSRPLRILCSACK